MDKIEVRLSVVQDTIRQYKSCRVDLESMLRDLNNGIEYLKQNWEGETRKSFFEMCYPTFSEGVSKHIKLIEFFETELTKYCDKMKALSSELKSNIA